MITTVVTFSLPPDLAPAQVRELFQASASRYRGLEGLVRKHYLLDEQERIGGGVYLWQSRSHAEAIFTADWKAWARERYGTTPDIRYFETPLVVDNAVA
jgi:hypothetical protein